MIGILSIGDTNIDDLCVVWGLGRCFDCATLCFDLSHAADSADLDVRLSGLEDYLAVVMKL